MHVYSKICTTTALIVCALMFAAAHTEAAVVPRGQMRLAPEGIQKPSDVQRDAAEEGAIFQVTPGVVGIKTCDPMAYFTEDEWPGIKILQPYEGLPPGGYEKNVWDGDFMPEESIELSIEDANQFNGDPSYATIKVERFVPGLTLMTEQEQRVELYGIKKERGAQLIINCLFKITVKNVSPGLSTGMNLTTGFAPQPCDSADCYLDLDVTYDTTNEKALYRIYTETADYLEKNFIDLVRGSNAVTPYRMIMDSIWVKGCPWWGKYADGKLTRGPPDTTSSYCGCEFGGEPGDEDFIVKITLENRANQDLKELKFYQSSLSGSPPIDGGSIWFDSVYLAKSQAVGKLQGITRGNTFGLFYFVTVRGSYVRYYPQQPNKIILQGFTWYANPTDYEWGPGGQPPGFTKKSYVFFRGERTPLNSSGWSLDFDGSDESKFVHNKKLDFRLANKLNITREYRIGGVWYVKSKWQVKAEIIPGQYTYPY